jgi:hypothetical protein
LQLEKYPNRCGGKKQLERAMNALLRSGRWVFALGIAALGVEHFVVARAAETSAGFYPKYSVIPVIPWLPAIPWLAYVFGAMLIGCAIGIAMGNGKATVALEGSGVYLRKPERIAGLVLGGLFFVCTVVLEVPKNAANLASMSLRTAVFEPLTIAGLAWLLAGKEALPKWLVRASRSLIGVSLVVFGVDHLLALVPIASLIPAWIPWHVFWIAFFGGAFIAAGVGIAANVATRLGAAGMGWMFAVWVFTLHLPRVLGWYGIPGAGRNPNEWSSLFIAVTLWGGFWAVAGDTD